MCEKRFTDFSQVVALAIQDQALVAQDIAVLPTSENPNRSETLSVEIGTDTQ